MKQGLFQVVANEQLTETVWKMDLVGDLSAVTAPGQFVNIQLDGNFLRRPISVCDAAGDRLTLVYKVVGKGTEQMSRMQDGTLDLLTGLGNGYDLTLAGERPLLLGGGVGVPPLYMLCKQLIAAGVKQLFSVEPHPQRVPGAFQAFQCLRNTRIVRLFTQRI